MLTEMGKTKGGASEEEVGDQESQSARGSLMCLGETRTDVRHIVVRRI